MSIETGINYLNIVLSFGISTISFILFLKTKRFFRWVRLMYAFDGAVMFFILVSSMVVDCANEFIYRGGMALVLTTILSSALLTFLGGGDYDPSDCSGK